jgi:DNA-binding GntR family transcriptional regulator
MNNPSLRDLEHDASEAVRLRARLVQDTLSLGPTRAAEKHGVTRQTAAKWTNLYRTSGTRRLSDPTRQSRAMGEMRHAILSAPLWMPTAKWSSRSIAEALGISQSYVARAWDSMRSSTRLADDLAAETQGCQPELLGLLVTSDYVVVAFRLKRRARRDGSAVPAHVNAGMQRSLRTVLSSDLIRHQILGVSPADATSFWEKVTAAVDADANVLAVASDTAPIPAEVAHRKMCRNASEWQSLFSVFVKWGASLSPQSLQDVEGELRQWARRPRREFTWVVPTGSVRGTDRPAARLAPRRLGPERALADEIVVTIRQGITNGRLAPGDRVTERYLAGRLRTTRGQVRSAMRLLERDGLLTITTGHAAVVPVLTTSDVVETYAARRALGALVIRASVRWPPEGRQSVIRSLDALGWWAAAGDVYRTGEADIEFQNTLAEASGLVRIAPMLQILAEHLRMFIAVMGLDYAYPIDAILRDDWGIFEAIDSGDGETAAELWRIKMNDATTYMLEQLSSAKKRSIGTV